VNITAADDEATISTSSRRFVTVHYLINQSINWQSVSKSYFFYMA